MEQHFCAGGYYFFSIERFVGSPVEEMLMQDYNDVTFVSISSEGRIEVDPKQGIRENNTDDNAAQVSRHLTATRSCLQTVSTKPFGYFLGDYGRLP